MSSDGGDRHGIVYVAPHPHRDHRGHFSAYWDNGEPDKGEPPRMIEGEVVFVDVEQAIAWGRARARKVLMRLGDDDTTVYSAGSERLPWMYGSPNELMPEWPPK